MTKFLIIIALNFFTNLGEAKFARMIRLNDKRTETVYVTPGISTLLSFPSRATKVVLGNKNAFSIQYIENDLAISALTYGGRSNLFIYLDGRRFGFNLHTVNEGGDEIVLVRDTDETKYKVKVRIDD